MSFCPSGRLREKRQVPGYRVSIRSRNATQQTKDKQDDTIMQNESGINQTINLGVFQGDPFPDDNEFVHQ